MLKIIKPKDQRDSDSVISNISRLRFNLQAYICFLLAIYFNFWLFFQAIGQPLLSFTWLQSEVLHFVACLVLSLPFFFLGKRKEWMFVVLFLLNVYLISNLVYYRTYCTLMPLSSFTLLKNLRGLDSCVITSFKPVDLLFVLSTILLMVLYLRKLKARMVVTSIKTRCLSALAPIIVSLSVVGYNLYSEGNKEINILSEHNLFKYDVVDATWNYSFLLYWGWEFAEAVDRGRKPIKEEHGFVDSWFKRKALRESRHGLLRKKFTGKNVIIIVVESLESFPIGKTIAGNVITPNLNEILKSSDCFYAPYVVPQVKDGRSSDSQLILNSGMLPINSGATCFRYPGNCYLTLAKALKRHGYSSHTLIGGEASYWNQTILNKDMGYDDLVSINDFAVGETYEFGLSDSSFFAQAPKKLNGFKRPFLAQVITLSSHYPFNLPENRIYLKVPRDCPTRLRKYLNAIHYTDMFLGKFLAGLKRSGLADSSVIVVTGDHDAFDHNPYLNDKYGSSLLSKKGFIPLIIINSGENGLYCYVLGQVDVYPTLLGLLGLNDYDWTGLGTSIFDKSNKGIAVDARMNVWSCRKDIKKEYWIDIVDAWLVSDIMIRRNMFSRYCSK